MDWEERKKMMEIAIALFIGIWLSGFAFWVYIKLKKDYSDVMSNMKGEKK